MFLQATDTAFNIMPALIFFLLLGIVILAVYWYNTRCPNCQRPFTRELLKKEKAGRLPTWVSGRERRHFRCTRCGHQWEKVIDLAE